MAYVSDSSSFCDSELFARFTSSDVSSFAPELIAVILTKIESSGSTAEKLAENDHLMKCKWIPSWNSYIYLLVSSSSTRYNAYNSYCSPIPHTCRGLRIDSQKIGHDIGYHL